MTDCVEAADLRMFNAFTGTVNQDSQFTWFIVSWCDDMNNGHGYIYLHMY